MNLHGYAIYYWSIFEQENSDKWILGLRFANYDEEYLIEDFPYDSFQEADREADRLNALEDIGDDLISRIITSQDWTRHPLDPNANYDGLLEP